MNARAVRTFLKRVVMVVVAAAVAVLIAGWWLGTRSAPPVPASTTTFDDAALIERGAYLARVGNCAACHTARGGEPFAGGRALPTPWGTLYGSNITPDEEHGIGRWSADDFWQALHDGRGRDGELLYPAFPYTSYTHITRADADAIYAWLRTVAPVNQASPAHDLPFPYNQRWLLAFWRALNFSPATQPERPAGAHGNTATDDDSARLLERGAYLAEGLGHCAECHTPRGPLGGLANHEPLAGAAMPVGGWYAPALTPDANGLAEWSTDDIAELLRRGTSAHGSALGPMAEVVFASTQYLTLTDARAIAAYLKQLPANDRTAGSPPAGGTTHGAQAYRQYCADCHGEQGEGKAPGWPALAGNRTVTLADPANAIRTVLNGGFAPGTRLNPQPYGMPPFRQQLSDSDIAAILSHARQSWGNQATPVRANQVQRARGFELH